MNELSLQPDDRVLVVGATGFVGRRLVRHLAKRKVMLRLLVRHRGKAKGLPRRGDAVDFVEGDLLAPKGLDEALAGIHTAFYLAHSLGESSASNDLEFVRSDRRAAGNFMAAAEASGLRRVIYLGGLGDRGAGLSPHLESRAEIADILSSGSPAATVLRAAVIIGAGGASFEMIRYLVERLPLIVYPDGSDTRIQPIAVDDVVAYLAGCLMNAETAGRTFDIGGPEILTYREMMEQYAEARGLAERFTFDLPLLPARMARFWVDLLTPVPSGVSYPLLEGLKNEVVCRDDSIDAFVPIARTPFRKAVRIAFSEEKSGPGIDGF